MNLQKLFETQRVLDEHIYEKHPELRGQNNLDWKILALQVELGECANEWRGFKKWSNDQEPRTTEPIECFACAGTGDENYEYIAEAAEGGASYEYSECEECNGTGHDGERNPLLEEYVDCLHFILSIGNGYNYNNVKDIDYMLKRAALINEVTQKSITDLFNAIFHRVGSLSLGRDDRPYRDDILPTFLILGERLGFTRDQIEDAYFAKNQINHKRQESGY